MNIKIINPIVNFIKMTTTYPTVVFTGANKGAGIHEGLCIRTV